MTKNNIKLVIGLVILGTIIVLVIFFMKIPLKKITGDPYFEEPQKVISRQDFEPQRRTNDFPTKILVQEGAKILYNFEAEISDGRKQRTISFESEDTVQQNFFSYASLLPQNGWKVISIDEGGNINSILATKDGVNLTVNISKNKITGITKIDLSSIRK